VIGLGLYSRVRVRVRVTAGVRERGRDRVRDGVRDGVRDSITVGDRVTIEIRISVTNLHCKDLGSSSNPSQVSYFFY
jgi:hypothetical protein